MAAAKFLDEEEEREKMAQKEKIEERDRKKVEREAEKAQKALCMTEGGQMKRGRKRKLTIDTEKENNGSASQYLHF